MKITEIYSQYKIMPNLQLHQLRVAAVATQIAMAAGEEINATDLESIKAATLLHDMGNIIKFKLGLFPESLEPEGLEYWEGVKQEFIEKYGGDEHVATQEIAAEIGISERAMQLLNSIGFSKAPENINSNDLAVLIVCYADHRVSPDGVTSLDERMEGGQARFKINKNLSDEDREKYLADFNRMSEAMRGIEDKIFARVQLEPSQVTNASTASIIEELKSFEIN